ncbi:MAG: ATP-binding cassette domain-containing protein [Candidatus Marinimicrobia bacterium]|jgi:ABC-2 type transport system ATP-binding protein|nr:ATP-binding cassette domain-containing protein [Candidatus Neomarinimicrobiota bacterium]MDD4961829.1 ATP-binding cassette domain-containing protein [Candidatus Neomarinimicrobiota bacterium]MDD5709728.1 ATP-binding cassette domain-containing protein [Candidatus Neomarinimicrobiota bacterium]MDX9778526.1 ATP-binding cassette domain-containing protein [bacterium]
MLKIEGISKSFTGVKAVNNISLEIPRGSIFGFLGPNGAGKTTTLRMIMNILQPDTGRILIDGIPGERYDHSKIGYLPEERGLYQKALVRDVVEYFAKLRSMSAADAKTSASYWFSRLQIGSLADKKVFELSKGNQQKVQFMIAVINDPQLMILDEPFTGLDPLNQKILREIMKEFKAQNRTVILSTHLMAKVEENCDAMCLIHRGEIKAQGATKDIIAQHGGSLDDAFIALVGEKIE